MGKQREAANGHDSDLHFLNYSVSANNESPYPEGRKQDRDSLLETSTEDRVEPCHIVEDTVLSMPRSISVNKIPNTVKTVAGDAVLSDKREEIKSHSVSETGVVEITEKGIATSMQEAQKPELNHLRSPLYDTDVGQGNDELIRKSEGKDSMVKNMTVSESNADVSKNLKECDDKRINSNREEVVQENELHSQDSSRTSGDNRGTNGAEGKVKEFVKIFNQEATSQPKNDIKTRIGQKDASASSSESRPDGSKVAVGNIDDLFQEDFVIKELSHDQYKLLQTEEGYDDIQISDAKTQQWSNGKEGNIRSLLSTLQYVTSDLEIKSIMKFGSKKGWKPKVLFRLRGKSAIRFCIFPRIKPAIYGPGNTPVYLNVYDLTPMNGYVYWAGFGIFHSGVEVHGVEYAFGAHDYPSSGVFEVEPRQCPGFKFRKSILIGTTCLDAIQVREFMECHSANYNGDRIT
ncbi:DeSI-like protein [Camellia lanceoleosa]|uniref:DeSI-like protein n=1 Tax=Camellia lanceoleosa TaxID=1840588 RepID=A0ACC0HUC2_9ERIC|nr:DeSI-like protein [Camellia lanceoleosa]